MVNFLLSKGALLNAKNKRGRTALYRAIDARVCGNEIDVFETQIKLRKQGKLDEKVFAEARELAILRLEQSVADLRMWVPMDDPLRPRKFRELREVH
jgi:hypothetical protein